LFNVLYYGYPFDDVRIGVDSTHHPVCISLERSGAKEQGLLGYSGARAQHSIALALSYFLAVLSMSRLPMLSRLI
jgi:hypothetical protein